MPLSSEAAGVSVDAVGACMMSGCDASLITGAECPSAFIGNGSGSSDECAKRRRLLHSRYVYYNLLLLLFVLFVSLLRHFVEFKTFLEGEKHSPHNKFVYF
jgi:hypothetical protein